MATKKNPITLTYKIGARYILTKAPKSLEFLKNATLSVSKANSKDVTFSGCGMLVVGRDEIKKRVFAFKPAPDEVILPATRNGFASINHSDGTTSEYLS